MNISIYITTNINQKKNKRKTSKQNNTKQKNYKSGVINQVIKTINQVFLQSFS